MATETKTPTRIDPEVRAAVMALVYELDRLHRLVDKDKQNGCTACPAMETALAVLEAEQREYGPPLDVTDPSWLREHPVS